MSSFYDALDPDQHRAVTAPRGLTAVIAGAGAGKTRVLTARMMHLVEQGTSPANVLCVTFTRRAAEEMRSRLGELVGVEDAWICTLHSACYRLLRAEVRAAADVGAPPGWRIVAPERRLGLIGQLSKELGVPGLSKHLAGQLSRIKTGVVQTGQAEPDERVFGLLEAYDRELRSQCLLDFDDLLVCADELLQARRDIRDAYAQRFEHVLLDECQDSSAMDWRIMQAFASAHNSLFIVGDPDQSIYGFRGADVQLTLRAIRDEGFHVVHLARNYRSQGLIVAAADALISHNSNRDPKTQCALKAAGLPVAIRKALDEAAEASYIAESIDVLRATTCLADIAVLTRTNYQLPVIANALMRYRIPYRYHNRPTVFEQPVAEAALAFLRFAADPRHAEAFRMAAGRIAPQPIAHNTARMLIAEARGQSIPDASMGVAARLSASVQAKLNSLFALSDRLSRMLPSAAITNLRDATTLADTTWGAKILFDLAMAAEEYEEEYEDPSIGGFIELVDEMLACDPNTGKKDAVQLMTIHAAKGKEFARVFLAGVEEGLLPHFRAASSDAVEEERRLMYVGITRAMEQLQVLHCDARVRYGRPHECRQSRFIKEMLNKEGR